MYSVQVYRCTVPEVTEASVVLGQHEAEEAAICHLGTVGEVQRGQGGEVEANNGYLKRDIN